MISLGGVIGAGLFVGSSVLISSVGPAVLLAYGICGLIVFLVMRMLAELALWTNNSGVFTEYTRGPLGSWAAFTSGWLYTYYWVIVIAVETIAAAGTLQRWLPLPMWLLATLLLGCLAIANLSAVRMYGELEFWFASIKVATIILFVAFGLGYVLLGQHGFEVGPALLFRRGGFAPHGYGAVLREVPAAMFAVAGAEIAAIAAVDSSDPVGNTARSVRTVVLRVLAFYLSSMLIILMMVPWSAIVSGYSPFSAALDRVGFGDGAAIMDAVILTAILSCLNSGIYVAARTLRGLADRGDAPSLATRCDARGTPYIAVLTVAVAAYALSLCAAFSYRAVFHLLLSASGAVMLFIYLLIALAQIVNRRAQERLGAPLPAITIWIFPWLSGLVVVLIVGVLGLMLMKRQTAIDLFASSASAIIVSAAYALRRSLAS
ncbi:MAG TPA: amino acid permease [Steroidobacteraceae bacterium]|nr:amino acid permease [Steroidobacteraceae bacterium]